MQTNLISVIIATKNEEENLQVCLQSIIEQTYKQYEIIVVDNNSIDKTKTIAKKFTSKVYNCGPERSSQRNYAALQSKGEYLLFLDADMKLSPEVLKSCKTAIENDSENTAVIIPEASYGLGFWAECKKLEKSFYHGRDDVEAARFFKKKSFQQVKGFEEDLISGEDWNLSQKIRSIGEIERTQSLIYHNEGHLRLIDTVRKKFYYAQKFTSYEQKDTQHVSKQTTVFARYVLFFSQPKKLFKNPLIGFGMLFMKTCEFGFGSLGYMVGQLQKK